MQNEGEAVKDGCEQLLTQKHEKEGKCPLFVLFLPISLLQLTFLSNKIFEQKKIEGILVSVFRLSVPLQDLPKTRDDHENEHDF